MKTEKELLKVLAALKAEEDKVVSLLKTNQKNKTAADHYRRGLNEIRIAKQHLMWVLGMEPELRVGFPRYFKEG